MPKTEQLVLESDNSWYGRAMLLENDLIQATGFKVTARFLVFLLSTIVLVVWAAIEVMAVL
jgi:hypothetical protein